MNVINCAYIFYHSFIEEYKTCAGPGTLAKECKSKWKRSAEKCCEGLVCEGEKCVIPDTAFPSQTPSQL